jgi:surface-anchored protein
MIKPFAIVASCAVLTLAAAKASAWDFVFTNEHIDVGIGYSGGVWDLHVHDHDNNTEWEPEDVLIRVGQAAMTTQPGGSQWSFIGAGAGNPVWILPQTQNPSLVFLGLAADEVQFGVFDNNQVWLSLTGLSGPGHFSLWTTDAFGNPTVRMATSDGISSADTFMLPVGAHAHANWGFTQVGLYEVYFRAHGFINGQRVESDIVGYNFEVVPEPATIAALALGAAAVAVRRRRSKA